MQWSKDKLAKYINALPIVYIKYCCVDWFRPNCKSKEIVFIWIISIEKIFVCHNELFAVILPASKLSQKWIFLAQIYANEISNEPIPLKSNKSRGTHSIMFTQITDISGRASQTVKCQWLRVYISVDTLVGSA